MLLGDQLKENQTMPSWVISITVPLVILFVNIAAQFYFRWVPNIEDQKRHLKTIGSRFMDVISFVAVAYWLYGLTRRGEPVTPWFVVEVSLAATCLCFVVVMNVVLRLVDLTSDHVRRLISLAWMYREALVRIGKDPALSAETVRELEVILNPKQTGPQD
jgi:hypothetical protein